MLPYMSGLTRPSTLGGLEGGMLSKKTLFAGRFGGLQALQENPLYLVVFGGFAAKYH
jgi:hypothetical protein